MGDALADMRKKEMNEQHAYNLVEQSLQEAIRNNKAQLADATSSRDESSEAKGKAKAELAAAQKTKAKDEQYTETLNIDCQTKADEWSERQKTSSEELAAIAKATEILSSGVKALVQVNSASTGHDSRRERVSTLLQHLSHKYQNFSLVQAAHAAKADPFGKVRGLVEQMIAKLQEEANKDATQDSFCREEMAKSNRSRDQKAMKVDKFQARIDDAQATIHALHDAIGDLQSQVASNDKAQGEALSLRNEEHAAYLKASQDYKDSSEAVANAVDVLKGYYESGSTPNSARSDAGSSILGILEVAESDFTRLLAETETQERVAQDSFDKASQENKESTLAKKTEIEGKQSEVSSL